MPDRQYKYVTAAQPMGDSWFNTDETRFALIPGDAGGFDHEAARMLEEMLEEFNASDDSERLNELLFDLVDLHGQQIVLWPLGLLWGRSVLGAVHEQTFTCVLSEIDPDFVELRKSIQTSEIFKRFKDDRQRQSYSFAVWKVLAAFHFSSSTIATLDDIQGAHFVALLGIIRPDGVWVEWATHWLKKTIRFTVLHISTTRDDVNFGRGIGDTFAMARGGRTANLFANAPQLRWLAVKFDQWINEQSLMTTKHHDRSKRFFASFLLTCEPDQVDRPERAFSRPNMVRLLRFANDWSTPGLRSVAIGHIHDFGNWLEEESRDFRGHPKIKCQLSQADVDRFRASSLRGGKRSNGSEVAARPMPYLFHQRLKSIILENDFAWAKSLISKITGRPRYWFTWVDPKTGVAQPVFNEVLPRLLLLLLVIPVRSIQARRLDSGEGDARRWNQATRLWETSTARHAGYWRALGVRNPERGVFREILSNSTKGPITITGLFINSNKTQDRANLFDETSGYVIPWELDEVLQNLAAMRDWQEKYNPVEGPLPHSKMPKGTFFEGPTKIARALIPDRFYLFRDPQNSGPRGKEMPSTYKMLLQFYYDALSELERRMREEDPWNPITIITERDPSGTPKKAIFTLHGMRSSTITSLYTEGVPIAVLSKLVAGHATILMTLKYAKFEPAHVSEILTQARIRAIQNSASEFKIFLNNATYEQAARMSAWLREDGLKQLKGAYADASSAWSCMDIGICPNGGTLCHIGGDRLHKKVDLQGERSLYKGTAGRDRNCVRCRFLVSGLPFLIPLWGHANMISARADQLQARIVENETEVGKLKVERREANARGEPTSPELRQRIRMLEADWENDMQLRDQAFADFHAALELIEKIRLARESGPDDGRYVPMLVSEDGLPDVEGKDSTRFELCDAVVQIGRFFPSLRSEELERERDEFLNKILFFGGYVPITLTSLTLEEKRSAADAMSAMLLGVVGAIETQNLVDGRKTLADLGLQDRLDAVVRQSIGQPLDPMPLIKQIRQGRQATVELTPEQ